MRMPVVVAFLFAILFPSLVAKSDANEQNATGPCSTNISNVSGNVTIVSSCMDPKAIEIFLKHINEQQRNYEEKKAEVLEWMARYNELAKRLGEAGAFEELRAQVAEAFKNGNLAAAGTFQEQLIAAEEKFVDQLAKDLYNRAEMLVLDLKSKDAIPFYARAFQYRPYDTLIAESYARSLCDANQTDTARDVYQRSVGELREKIQRGEQAYIPNIACMLVNLGGVYYDAGDFVRARAAAIDALSYARRIKPPEGPLATEYIADALTGQGISEVRLGDARGRELLREAVILFRRLKTPVNNHVIAHQMLAHLARMNKSKAEEEQNLKDGFDLSLILMSNAAIYYRATFVRIADDLFTFYELGGDLSGARRIMESVKRLADEKATADIGSGTLLAAVAKEMAARIYLLQGDTVRSRDSVREALDLFKSIASQLRLKETSLYAVALNTAGWVGMRDSEYRSAQAFFADAIKTNKFPNSFKSKQFFVDKYISDFFVGSFHSVARQWLEVGLITTTWERDLWTYILARSQDPRVVPELPSSIPAPQYSLMDLARRSSIELDRSVENASSLPPLERCRDLFFAGEISSIEGHQANALKIYDACGENARDNVYSWIIKARQQSPPRK